MDEYVKRQYVDDAVGKFFCREYDSIWLFAEDIEAIPTEDVQPVVRCRDCKHWWCPPFDDPTISHSCDVDALLRPADHFCAYGEK